MTHLSRLVQVCFAAMLGLTALPAKAHEFWIDPINPFLNVGEQIDANIRVGEMMKGSGLIYNPKSFTNLAAISPDEVLEISGRLGDRPALSLTTKSDGLHVLAYMTTANKLKYKEFDKFATFAKTHGQAFAIDEHKALSLPETDFTEAYFRCAKALLKVGSGAGDDRIVGFPFELTALTNPYTSEGDVRVLLTYKGNPKPDHQIDVFHKTAADPNATMVSYTTNAKGEVTIPRKTGDFLINAVALEQPKPNVAEKLDAIWVSLWASTTYSIK